MNKKHLIWIIPLALIIGFLLASIGVQEVYNERLEFLVINGNDCHNFLMKNHFNISNN